MIADSSIISMQRFATTGLTGLPIAQPCITKAFKKGSHIATHAWLNDHSIDFKSVHVIDKGNFRVRKTLESWHTAITSDADNNAKQLPRQYSILL